MAGSSTGPFDPEGLSTVFEVPHQRKSHEPDQISTHNSPPLRPGRPSHDASLNSSYGASFHEKAAEPPPVPYATDPRRSQHVRRISDGKLKKRNTVSVQAQPQSQAQFQRRGGLRNTIKRMFGRKSAKQRASMPAAKVYQAQDEHGTSLHDSGQWESNQQVSRSASVPTNAFIRSSGLSSHPPFERPVTRKAPEPAVEKPEERSAAPVRPQRPRRSSLPSDLFTKEDLQAVTDAIAGFDQSGLQSHDVDSRNIGFAVTPGSNPKRRSRSAGAIRESDHRMSPIQWRNYRPRSDDFTHLRQSREVVQKEEEAVPRPPDSTSPESEAGAPPEDFNFGLQEGLMQENERMGLEERLITLEIKLMDLEYNLSRIQAGSRQLSRQTSKGEHRRQQSTDTATTYGTPSIAARSQASNQSGMNRPQGETVAATRPTSVATTLKPGTRIQTNSFSSPAGDWQKRLSLSALTIEHYSTLVTLVRHEQSARMRLEEQVSQLQQRFEDIQTQSSAPRFSPSSISNHARELSSSSQLSRRIGTMRDERRRRGKFYHENRPRSSSYSTNETDTEDDYHDAYLTPTNLSPRGEYERGAFNKIPGVEDGEAF